MSKSAMSVRVFAVYLFCMGAILVLIPNTLLILFRVPETNEVWIRVVGVLIFLLGYYYFKASGKELLDFYRWTVHARLLVLFFFLTFVFLGLAPPVLILVGVIDAVAALWTASCLRREA